MFAMLLLEKNLEWYRKILAQTLSERRPLNINPKNCIGTVLSLNGHRKYFCVYHAKHLEPAVLRKVAAYFLPTSKDPVRISSENAELLIS